MRIVIVTPAAAGSTKGNRVTALRWGRILRGLGHRVVLAQEYRRQSADLLVALHAVHSAPSVERFLARNGGGPVIVALTGTDVYRDLHRGPIALRTLEAADRIVALQPLAAAELPAALRPRVRVIYQSAGKPPRGVLPRSGRSFDVCVLGHLREIKDPFRTALAARALPEASRLHVVHIGAALTPDMADRAREEARLNPRYTWLGELPRHSALMALARCRILALTSQSEGGANAISEALAAGVPVIASRIPGSVGLLGEDYAGYFPVGDTKALTAALDRAETDPTFYALLENACAARAGLFAPAREAAAWAELLKELRPRTTPAA